MDLFGEPERMPVGDIDVRVHGRYYRDPPEFLTFMHGGTDGLHYGLWFDDGRTCSTVASYYNNDGGGIDTTASTPLEAVRALLERFWRDLQDDERDEEADVRSGQLALLRDALTAVETGDRPEVGLAYSSKYDRATGPVDPHRITTLDGAGGLASGASTLDRPGHRGVDEYKFATYMYDLFDDAAALRANVEDARRRCAQGDPTEALLLGRDLHWASAGDTDREALAHELLVLAYRALDRPALRAIAEAHHRHRSLPQVDVLEG
ncbi:ADP-ribosylation family protein [Streptomyces sp. NPDC055099]